MQRKNLRTDHKTGNSGEKKELEALSSFDPGARVIRDSGPMELSC